jgi:hypothetical protein
MRVFDWQEFLQREGIAFITRGANVKRGELCIRCPMCGSADPSYHMGLNLTTGWYACWRNSQHRGKSPLRLIMQLLSVPYYRAREIAGLGEDYVDPEGFDAVKARLLGQVQETEAETKHLVYDDHFRPVTDKISTRRFWNYVYSRNFAWDDVDQVCREYELMAGVGGKFESRLILPYIMDGKLVSWTGRAITDSTIRYKDLSIDESLVPIKETLFNFDCISEGGKVLVLQEGPVDALKVDFYGKDYGVRSVALSTNSISEEQIYLLQTATDKFSEFVVMMDSATALGVVDSMRLKQQLVFLPNLRITAVPFGAKDGGALKPSQCMSWAEQITKGK